MPNEVLIKVRPGSASMVNLYHSSLGATVLREFPAIGWQKVRIPATVQVSSAINYYGRLAGISAVTPNRYRDPLASVNDPLYSQQYSATRMRVDFGWDLTTGDDKVVVAVLDTGVDYNHPDLVGKVTKGSDFASNDADPMDEQGHGTHVAGITGAHTNNGIGIAGMGYNTRILAIRVLGPFGGTEDMVVSGILEAANKGADIINMSLGAPFYSQVEQDAVNYAWNKNVVVIAGAGNNGTTARFYPAALDNVISVASSDAGDLKSDFSTYGDWVDVTAPGSDIMSTLPGGQYGKNSGTSMASPNAAGVAALIISYAGKGAISNAEVRDIMTSTAFKVGNFVIHGRIDADAAVRAAIPPIINKVGPATARMFDGASFTGNATSLWANDASNFTVFSRFVSSLGGVAGAEMSYVYDQPATKFQGGTFTVRGYGKYGTTATAYIKKNDGTYVKLKSWPVSGSQITTSVAVPKLITPYLNNGKLTFVVRGVLPSRFGTASWTYGLNSAMLETRTASR